MNAQVFASGIVTGCLYALVAFGFALIYHTTRTFHFALGATYTFGVYVFYWLHSHGTFPLWVTLPLALLLTALLGVAIDEVVYRPLLKRKSSQWLLLLSSLATYMIIINLIIMVFGNEIQVLSSDIQPTVHFGNVVLSLLQTIIVSSCVAVLAFAALCLRLTRLGKLIRALRDDVDLISVLGVNPRRLRWIVFAIGSALAGLAAVLQGLDVGADPNAGMVVLLSAAVGVIIGGKGNFEASIVGALIVGVLHAVAVWNFSGQWQESTAFVLLIVFLLLRPEGIFGRRRRIEEINA